MNNVFNYTDKVHKNVNDSLAEIAKCIKMIIERICCHFYLIKINSICIHPILQTDRFKSEKCCSR